jgi:hypothetical protein
MSQKYVNTRHRATFVIEGSIRFFTLKTSETDASTSVRLLVESWGFEERQEKFPALFFGQTRHFVGLFYGFASCTSPCRHGVSDGDPAEHVVAKPGTPPLRATSADPCAVLSALFASPALHRRPLPQSSCVFASR